MYRTLTLGSLITGPVLLALSTFFWVGGRYGIIGGILVAAAGVAWLYGLIRTWERVAGRHAWIGATGIVLTLAGSFGGIAFGLQGFFEALFGLTGAQSLRAAGAHPIGAAIVLWVPGPMMPLCLAALGVTAGLNRAAPWPTAVLVAFGGLAFPLGRIARMTPIAHVTDALIVLSFVLLAVAVARRWPNRRAGTAGSPP